MNRFVKMLKVSNLSFKSCLLFIVIGLSLAFPLGLFMLTIGPTRIISDKAHAENWSENQENTIQKIIILAFVFLVLFLTISLFKYFYKSNHKKLILAFSFILLLSATYIFAFEPEFLINNTEIKETFEKSNTVEFYFGSYPDVDKIQQLKSENYTAIISLLHPMVIPAEPILMEKEIINTKKEGLKLISIPMLPWIIGNDSSLIKIKELAKNAKGKYYVHCYLGKDRVNVFRTILEKENKFIKIISDFTRRNIDTVKQFERGRIYKLNNTTYFTPYPTDEEFFSFVLNGKVKTVISLMNIKNPDEKPFIDKEQNIMNKYNMYFKNIPINCSEINKIKILIDSISKLPKPILIHNFSTESVEAKNFIENFKLKYNNN